MRDIKHCRICLKWILTLVLLCLSACGQSTSAGIRTIDIDTENGTAKLSIYLPEGWVIDDSLNFESADIASSTETLNADHNQLASSTNQIKGTIFHYASGSPRYVTVALERGNLTSDDTLPELLNGLRNQLYYFNFRYTLSNPELINVNSKPAAMARGTVKPPNAPTLDAIIIIVDEGDGFSYFNFHAAQGQIAQYEEAILLIVGTVVVEK